MTEAILHLRVCQYLQYQYPTVVYRTDFAAGIKMTVGQARRHKALQSGRAYPDLFIAQPVGGYHGLYLELKSDKARLYLKNGGLVSVLHIQEQAQMLEHLRSLGYAADFAQGFEQAKAKIDGYLQGKWCCE